MRNLTLPELVPMEKEASDCRGKIYRYLETAFVGKRGDVNTARRFVPLKRLSCSGCDQCGYLEEDIHEGFCSSGMNYIEIDPKLKSGDMAQAVFVPDGVDWESGLLDAWYIRFDKYTTP